MSNGLNGKSLFIDFDSTFVKVETIDEIARITLQDNADKDQIVKKISNITNQAMSGKMDFPTALEQRLQILSITDKTINTVTNEIKELISDSFYEHKDLIKDNASNIWIISGGFTEVIAPIVESYGIKRNHILANQFIFDGDKVSGCDKDNFLFLDKGKIKAINSVETSNPRIMIGDGYTDLEVYLEGACEEFICYTENISRKTVLDNTKYSASSFGEILDILHHI